MSLLDLVHRLRDWPALVAAILSALVGAFALTAGGGRLSGSWFVIAALGGIVLFLLSALRLARRVMAAPLPGPLRPLAPHAENFMLLIAINLVILSPLTPLFDLVARGMAAGSRESATRYVLGALGRLTGPVLVTVFGIGALVVAWILVLRVLEPLLRGRGGQRMAGALDRAIVGGSLVFCAGAIVLAYNSGLDAGAPSMRRADLISVSGVRVPFLAGGFGWADVRYLEPSQRTERILLLPDDEIWPQRAAPGLPLHLLMRPGLLGIPWVQRVAVDRERDLQRALVEVPTAAALRKSLINSLSMQRRWAEVRAETEAHARVCPEDGAFVREVAALLRQNGQGAHADALDRLGARP
jgi:hypothetical protein